jgi:hypothetical protein
VSIIIIIIGNGSGSTSRHPLNVDPLREIRLTDEEESY